MLRRICLLALLSASFSVFAQYQSGETVTLRYCIDPDWMPYEAIRNGDHVGISRDYIQLVANITNIDLTFVSTQSWADTLDAISDGRCDLVPMIHPTASRAELLSFTIDYFEAPNVLVTRTSDDAIPGFAAVDERLLGVVRGSRHTEYLARYYRSIKVQYVDSEAEGLRLLSQGDIDVLVASLLSASIIINNANLSNVVMSGYAEPHDTLAMGLEKSLSHLIPRLNEAISSIPESKKVEVYKRWYRVKPVSREDDSWLVFGLISLLVVGIVAAWIKRAQATTSKELARRDTEMEALQSALVEKSRTVEFLTTHDELTTLHNRNFMVQKVDEEMSRFRRFHSQVTLLLIGVDNLARIAQNVGRDRVDSILRKLAEITLEKTREVDVAARWTNEEILILCPQTSTLSAQILAERILTEVELQSLQLFEGIKVSIGGASMQEGDSFVDWFDRAQQAMRKAKKQMSHTYQSG